MKPFRILQTSVFLAIASSLFMSCSKDRIEPRVELNAYESPNAYLDSKKQEEQDFLIDTNGTGPIIGNQKTHIWGSKNCLMFPNGDSVSFPFNVKLIELYTPKDMIYARMPTVSSNRILETGGEVRIRAVKNGVDLVLRPGCAFQVSMKSTSPQPDYMRVFYGYELGEFINWTDNLSDLGITQLQNPVWALDTVGYTALIERLGWINCDRLAGTTSGATLTFESEVDDLSNVAIFAYMPATKTVMQAYNQSMGIVPIGTAIKLIAIAQDSGGNLFSTYQELTVSGSQTIDITLSPTTDANLTSVLSGL